ncbi:MAG TPA: molybdenum ABC transporter ATP-binding protein [Myxococcota bacterium]|nr:molybdenum ABC transporter ATP-binding protein [Myxococcota bacterium]
MLSVRARVLRGEFALDVAFETPTPGVTALFGRSGCGKTTLVHAIAGLLTPAAGRISLDGEAFFDDAARVNVPAERRRVGCVFQDARLFPHFSVLGNLRYGARRAPGDSRRIGMDDVVDLLGLQALLSRRPAGLSGGERHRVAIGRALLSQPRLLLLDEPLAAQDLARRAELLPYLDRLCRELRVPIVYVSHQFDEVVQLADRVVVLESGGIAAQGGIEELSRAPALRAIVGPEATGAVVDGRVTGEAGPGRVRVQLGAGSLALSLAGVRAGERVRVHLLARDVWLALERPPGGLVADVLPGKIRALLGNGDASLLVEVDVGGALLLARAGAGSAAELAPGREVFALVNAAASRAWPIAPSRSGGSTAGATRE